MDILDTVKGTVNTAVDAISEVAQTFVEKNRTKAKLNRLRLVMKNESEMMNRAYIALGKQFYEMQKKNEVRPVKNQEQLFEVIEQSKAKIAKARTCYKAIIDSQNDYIYRTINDTENNEAVDNQNLVDITVACSNESDYSHSPFEECAKSDETEDITVAQSTDAPAEKETAKEPTADISKPDGEGESPESELF